MAMNLDTTRFRFTLAEIREADDLQFGFCLACRATREGCEPDAENYDCPECGEHAVYGPHWLIVGNLIGEEAP
jgi:hypothetical protein